VELTEAEIADATQGRFVRPAAGVGAAEEGATIRLVAPDGKIVGIARRDGRRIAPEKILRR
jgi:hypothetical protein